MSDRMGKDPQLAEHPDVVALQRQFGPAGSSSVVGEGLLVCSGAWLAIAPWVVGFAAGAGLSMAINYLVVGLVVVALGLRLSGNGNQALSWAGFPLGVWAIIATWLVPAASLSAGMIWSNVVGGAVVILAAAAVTSGTMISVSKDRSS